jgi:predicted deacylase
MRLQQTAAKVWGKIQSYPKKYTISGAVLFVLIILYAIIFFIEKPVIFSYAGTTCTKQLTLFPSLHRSDGDLEYKIQPSELLKLGTLTIASRATCFTPIDPPRPGTIKVGFSPWGGWLMRKTYAIAVGTPPTARVAVLDKPVPVSRPLTIPLSDTDKTFTYHMKAGDKEVECISKDKATACDITKLELLQGKPYMVELTRQFDKKKIGTVVKKEITTLSATHAVDSTIKPGEIVYAKPRIIDVVFDKKLSKTTSVLYRIEGDKRTAINTTLTVADTKLQLTIAEDLPRSMNYELVVESVEAGDGSGLEAPYVLPFTVSGGPKVTGISIGRTGVAIGATGVITFDQTLSERQDISKIITFTGGAALSAKKGNQLFVSLTGVPKCGDFSIKITNDLQSNYDIAGNSGWSFTGRTICHTIGTIGYSSKGRAINAYYFGSGSSAVLYTGAIHGNELGTRTLMNNWINDLEANARNIPANKTVVVVPQINPDGVASGMRVNGRNVDLNRNFGTSDWQKDITTVNNQPFPGGGGESPMSEPETQAIAGLASRLRPAVILSYHSQGSVVAANQVGASSALAGAYSQLSGYRNTTGQSGSTFEYSISGTADDWYGERLGVASVLIELGSHGSAQFSRNQKAMWAMLNNS